MSQCAACGHIESNDLGTNNQDGWLCSRCGNLGNIPGNAINANAVALNDQNPNILMVGVLGNFNYTQTEIVALQSTFNNDGNDSGLEDIWAIGTPARHQTKPHTNIVVVFTRDNDQIRVYGIGRHTGRSGNDNYRVLRWNGSRCRVTRN